MAHCLRVRLPWLAALVAAAGDVRDAGKAAHLTTMPLADGEAPSVVVHWNDYP